MITKKLQVEFELLALTFSVWQYLSIPVNIYNPSEGIHFLKVAAFFYSHIFQKLLIQYSLTLLCSSPKARRDRVTVLSSIDFCWNFWVGFFRRFYVLSRAKKKECLWIILKLTAQSRAHA